MVNEDSSSPALTSSTPLEELPEVPSKDGMPNLKPVYNLKSPMATILMYRQSDLNNFSMLFAGVDVYLNESLDIKGKVGEVQETDGDKFWVKFLHEYASSSIRKMEIDPQEVEKQLSMGLPADLRSLVYLMILNIKSVVDSQTYESLVKKAKLAEFEGFRKNFDDTNTSCELLQVYWYCLQGAPQVISQKSGLLGPRFVESVARVLQTVKHMEKAEMLTILFQISQQFAHYSKEEFAYKGSRALEDMNSKQFLHITKQGIDISCLVVSVIEGFFAGEFSQENSLCILDLVLFEGPAYILRLLCALFEEQSDEILSHDGDSLNELLFSQSFLASISKDTLLKSTKVEFPIIKYENEFSLVKANSISGNDNEISNLSEMNHELTKKLHNIRKDYSELQKTHEEIFAQNTEYANRLTQAREEKIFLAERKKVLQEKYSQLTMQENLSNTIKANTDISRENQLLEEQIELLTKQVEAKAKLIK